MKLKSVEIQGFKSFPDKTKLEFSQPITAVVGPNGSGKSNIGDAIRWVLGEQSTKNLRGAKMEDVIFGGTQQRKPMGFASVTLTIDNLDHAINVQKDEVSICRKIFRSGESEYKINNEPVRLKDIYELFLDTGLGRDGYSIIGQGKISEIISAKSTDRREIFEEAAGISKYRYHKSEAQKRLSLAEENLARLLDILSELEARVIPLKEENEKALKFVKLAEEKKSVEISVWLNSIDELKVSIKEQEDKITIAKLDYDDVTKEIDKIEEEINSIFQKIQAESILMDNNRNEIKTTEGILSELLSQKAVAENNINHNLKLKSELENELSKLSLNKDDLDAEIEEISEKSVKNLSQIAEIKSNSNELKLSLEEKKSENSSFTEKIEQLKLERTTIYSQINDAKLKAATSSTVVEQINKRLIAVIDEIEHSQQNSIQRKINLEQIVDAINVFNEKRNELNNEKNGYELKLKLKNEKLEEIKAKQRAINDEIKGKQQHSKLLIDMENSMEGFSYSVKFIHNASISNQLTGIYGTISSIINTDSKFSLAIETALGSAMQNIIVADEYVAKQAISLLKEKKAGRATFLPVTSVHGNTIDTEKVKNETGFIGLASSLVHYDNKFDGIIKSLLGRVIIAENLDYATAIAKKYGYKFRIVTLDGQVINSGGSFTGGSHSQTAGALSRRALIEKNTIEINNLKNVFEKMTNDYKVLFNEINLLNESISKINSEIQVLENDSKMVFSEKIEIEYAIKNEDKVLKSFLDEQEKLNSQLKEFDKNSFDEKQLITVFDEKLKSIEKQISEFTISRDLLNNEIIINNNELNELDTKLLLLLKDNEQINLLSDNLKAQKTLQDEQKQNLKEKISNCDFENIAYQKEIDEIKIKTEESNIKITKLQSEINDAVNNKTHFEQEITSLRNKTKTISISRETISGELARLSERKNSYQNEYDSIITKLWEEYELTKTQALEYAHSITDIVQEQKRLVQLKSDIKNLGNVNVGAIEEYKEVNERYKFMKSQVDDIIKSKEQLQKLITDLTNKMSSIFTERFAQINKNFKRIFSELFEGGKAEIFLTEPNNILESGIEISVEPPGKIIKNLNLLSGGEQSFVAIAIYFSILTVNPSPFCILDEIEAALDDVNVGKYAKYLRKLSLNTQFIAITHRRGTMEEADVLYGVTMEEEGVSKLLQLKVTEIEKRLGIKGNNI